MTARFGIAIPQHYPDAPVNPNALKRFVTTAEALGYDSLWVGEEIFHAPALDPLSLLTFAAAHTERVRLGTAVLVTTLRSPPHLAKEVSTLDNLSGGRVDLGIGFGTSTKNYPAFGISPKQRIRRYLEGIEVLRKLWTEDAVTFDGEYWKYAGQHIAPTPVQKPYPPLWFAGRADVALERAARIGDGWIGGKTVLADFSDNVTTLRRFLEQQKRDPATFPIAKRVYVQLDASKARVEGRLMDFFGRTYGDPEEAKRAVIYGGAAECVDRVAQFVSAGCQVPIFEPIFDQVEQMEALAKEVLPSLRR